MAEAGESLGGRRCLHAGTSGDSGGQPWPRALQSVDEMRLANVTLDSTLELGTSRCMCSPGPCDGRGPSCTDREVICVIVSLARMQR